MALGDKPYYIDNPQYGTSRPRHTDDSSGESTYYSAGSGEYLKDANSHSLYQIHDRTSKALHGIGEALAKDPESAATHGISPGTAAQVHGTARAYGRVAMGHFDDAVNRPDRVLNKMQFQPTERLGGGAANYQPRQN